MSEVSPTCSVCGLHYLQNYPPDVRYHKKVHDVHVNGPKIALPDGLHLIAPKSPLPHRRAAEQAALLFKHELGFDFPTYCATDTEDSREHRTIASIYVSQARVVGFLVERDVRCTHQYRLGDENWSEQKTETLCRRLDAVWVVKSHRGKAIGKKLLASFIERNSDKPLGIQMPISPDGERLLRSLRLNRFWVG